MWKTLSISVCVLSAVLMFPLEISSGVLPISQHTCSLLQASIAFSQANTIRKSVDAYAGGQGRCHFSLQACVVRGGCEAKPDVAVHLVLYLIFSCFLCSFYSLFIHFTPSPHHTHTHTHHTLFSLGLVHVSLILGKFSDALAAAKIAVKLKPSSRSFALLGSVIVKSDTANGRKEVGSE